MLLLCYVFPLFRAQVLLCGCVFFRFQPVNWLNWTNSYQNGMYVQAFALVLCAIFASLIKNPSEARLLFSSVCAILLMCKFGKWHKLPHTFCPSHSSLLENGDHFVIRVNRTSCTYVILSWRILVCAFIFDVFVLVSSTSVCFFSVVAIVRAVQCACSALVIDDMQFNKLSEFTRNSVAFNTNNKMPKKALTQNRTRRTGDDKMIFARSNKENCIIIWSMFSTLVCLINDISPKRKYFRIASFRFESSNLTLRWVPLDVSQCDWD